MTAARRLQITLDTDELTIHDEPASSPLAPEAPGRVEFAGVRFGYRPGVPVLTDIDLGDSLAPSLR